MPDGRHVREFPQAKTIVHTNAADATFTVRTDANLTWDIGDPVEVMRKGAGNLEVVPSGGVTIHNTSKPKANAVGSVFTLRKIAANTWVMHGDIKA